MKKTIILILILFSFEKANAQSDLFSSSYPDTSLGLSKAQYNADTSNYFRLNQSETVTGALTTFSGKVTLNDIFTSNDTSFFFERTWFYNRVNISDSLRMFRKEFPGSTSPYVIQVDSSSATDFLLKIQQITQAEAFMVIQNSTSGFDNASGLQFRLTGLNGIIRNLEAGSIRFLTPGGADLTLANTGALTNTGHYLVATDNTYDLGASGTEFRNIYYQGTLFGILDTPPATAGATGTAGEIRFGTDGYLYLCTATDTWVRVQLVTW